MSKLGPTKASLSNVVERYLINRIGRDAVLLDFLPEIHFDPEDSAIMSKWREFFRAKRVPYIITKNEDHFTLWKEYANDLE